MNPRRGGRGGGGNGATGRGPNTTSGRMRAQQPGDLPLGAGVVAELAVGPTEEGDVAAAEQGGGAPLLLFAQGDEHRLVLVGVPTPLRTVGQHEVVEHRARRRPLGQRGAAAELDVVGMGADGQGGRGHGQVDREGAARRQVVHRDDPGRRAALASCVSSSTSAGQSTS